MPAVRLYALSRFGLDVAEPQAVQRRLLARVRGWARVMRDVRPWGPRVTHPVYPGASEDVECFVRVYTALGAVEAKSTPGVARAKSTPSVARTKSSPGEVGRRTCADDESDVKVESGVRDPLLEAVSVDGARRAVEVLMQRRLLGHLERMLLDIQDFVEVACGADANGRVSHEKKHWLVQLMTASIPIAYLYAAIRKGAVVGRMLAYGEGEPSLQQMESGVVVYARWNLTNNSSYVGETEKWGERITQHYMNTLAHGGRQPRCSGCTEHAKYLKHRPIAASGWFMTPVRVCASKADARLLERKIERVVGPTLNRTARKYPIEHNYMALERKMNKERRERSKQRSEVNWQQMQKDKEQGRRASHDISVFSIAGQEKYFSLENLLSDAKDAKVQVAMVQYRLSGARLGSWRRLRRLFGETEVSTSEDGFMTLSEWCERCGSERRSGWLWLHKIIAAQPMSEYEFIREHQIEDGLSRLDDGRLMMLWHDRKKIARKHRGMMIRKIWDEHEIRYDGLTRRAISFSIPFVHGLDPRAVKAQIVQLVDTAGAHWPEYIRQWHKQNMRITTTARQSVGEVLTNVNQPWRFGQRCVCHEVEQRLTAAGWGGQLPKTAGHIFLLGRDYKGPCCQVMSTHACNIPKPTGWDVKRVWDAVRDQLPDVFRAEMSMTEWTTWLDRCRMPAETAPYARVTTAAVYKLRKMMSGLVCGPTDKNNGELWMACPCLYQQAMDKLYATGAGDYERVLPKKMSAYRCKKFQGDALLNHTTRSVVLFRSSVGL